MARTLSTPALSSVEQRDRASLMLSGGLRGPSASLMPDQCSPEHSAYRDGPCAVVVNRGASTDADRHLIEILGRYRHGMTDRKLVVLAGRPGTGKTTLGRLLATNLPVVYVRVDAIETAVVNCGLAQPPVGVVGYLVAHEMARANLVLGSSVVVDAVNPVPEARTAWRDLATETGSTLSLFETVLHDPGRICRGTWRATDLGSRST